VRTEPHGRRIETVTGRALPLRGDDFDTDRIMPARFLKSVTFDGLERHVFADDRAQASAAGLVHPFDNPAFRGAAVLLVNRNFGCGSSREHAPQGLHRWGVRAIVGESFSEIFQGNCLALGVPCLTLDAEAVEALMRGVESDPTTEVAADVAALQARAGRDVFQARLPASLRAAFLDGTWDATGLLLDGYDEVRAVEARLPYPRFS
jgi:3-isopropylmalate/(R)-2-methylmalate dehydratase small subunit